MCGMSARVWKVKSDSLRIAMVSGRHHSVPGKQSYVKLHALTPFATPPPLPRGRQELREAGKNSRGHGPDYLAHVFIFLDGIILCRLYILTLAEQAQITLLMTVFFFDLV